MTVHDYFVAAFGVTVGAFSGFVVVSMLMALVGIAIKGLRR